MNNTQFIKSIAAQLRDTFGADLTVGIQYRDYAPDEPIVEIHRVKDYERGREIMRLCGCGKVTKNVHDDLPGGRCVLYGSCDGINYTCFVDALPPSCRFEKIIERIPKQITQDTGEFIEVERTKVICGQH